MGKQSNFTPVTDQKRHRAAHRGAEMSRATVRNSNMSTTSKVLLVAGPGRSGTTLLTIMLSSHPSITIAHEIGFLPDLMIKYGHRGKLGRTGMKWLRRRVKRDVKFKSLKTDMREFADRLECYSLDVTVRDVGIDFLDAYANAVGGGREWIGHKKNYLKIWKKMKKVFPEARLITIFRDPRDTSWSAARKLPGQNLISAARAWSERAKNAERFAMAYPGEYLEIKYENLVVDAEAECRRICEFLGVPFSEKMLEYHWENDKHQLIPKGAEELHSRTSEPVNAARVGTWQNEMPDKDVALVEYITGLWMSRRGYAKANAFSGRPFPERVAVMVRAHAGLVIMFLKRKGRTVARLLGIRRSPK